MKIIVVIPTYNERNNIQELIKNIFKACSTIEVLVIDDNSPDGTSEVIEKLLAHYSNLRLITRRYKLGLASAYIDGFRYALEKGYEVIIQMDADLSHSPFYIPPMIDLLNEYDLVIGSRYIKGGDMLNCPPIRTLLSKLANIFAKTLLAIPINDLTSGFKCMKANILKNIDFSAISPKGYVFQIEMVFRAFLEGFKIVEYPILFEGRKNEKSKMSLGVVMEAFFRVIFLCFDRFLQIKN